MKVRRLMARVFTTLIPAYVSEAVKKTQSHHPTLKHFALQVSLSIHIISYQEATEMINQVLKSTSAVINVNILLICHLHYKNIPKKLSY